MCCPSAVHPHPAFGCQAHAHGCGCSSSPEERIELLRKFRQRLSEELKAVEARIAEMENPSS